MTTTRFRFGAALILVLMASGCSKDETAVANAMIATQPAKPSGSITAGKTEPQPGIVARAINPTLKPGCNYNTSCKLNCEWCAGNTCTCRLKGIP